MPRTNVHNSSQVSRARNRINNKSRLRVVFGVTIDGEVLGEESTQNQSYGVDAEDSTEHHLQAVLSANWQRNSNAGQRATRGQGSEKEKETPAAYIPTPDSTGVVADHEALYPLGAWRDPETYIKSSDGVDETISFGLRDSFTYLMDERDEEWLDKNNEEARGEGTSAQGALTPGARTSRSTKGKGKESDACPPFTITPDEFELVMGLYDLFTHEKTPFLHHSLEHDSSLFPPFSDYQELFSEALSPDYFATFSVPAWTPGPNPMLRLARTIYSYWRERRIDRGGHRVIPCLNFDEADVANESYICFRRREIKAIRKTRASQASSSDKLLRLQAELIAAQALVDSVIQRENNKRLLYTEAFALTDKRLALIEMKAIHPLLNGREDEDLLIDKERPPKRSRADSSINRIKLRPGRETTPSSMETALRPRERLNLVLSSMDRELSRQTERDHHWDDRIESAYQTPVTSYARKLFTFVAPPESAPEDIVATPIPRAVRVRAGRSGRILVDRREDLSASAPMAFTFKFPSQGPALPEPTQANSDLDPIEAENLARHVERWKFDADDLPDGQMNGSEEVDRVLVDDYDLKYMRHNTTLLQESDHAQLQTDNTLFVPGEDGKPGVVQPYRLGPVAQQMNRRPMAPVPQNMPNGTPQGYKRMPPPNMMHARIPSNGSIPRLPGVQVPQVHPLVPSQSTVPQPIATGQNGVIADPKITAPPPHVNGHAPSPVPPQGPASAAVPTADAGFHPIANGFAQIQVNGATFLRLPNGQTLPYNASTMQQIQELKMAYVNNQQMQANVLNGAPAFSNGMYGQNVQQQQQHFNNIGQPMKLSLPPQRSQWTALTQQMQQNAQLAASMPGRTPSANGKRIQRPPSANMNAAETQAHITSYLQLHGPSGLPMGMHPNGHMSPLRPNSASVPSPRLAQPAVGGQ